MSEAQLDPRQTLSRGKILLASAAAAASADNDDDDGSE